MREHKYQAWHKKLKRMHQVVGINFTLQEVNIGDPTQKGHNEHWYVSDIELRAYTGLKDYKGNEIYEGDIVKVVGMYGEIQHAKVIWGPVNNMYTWMNGETWLLHFSSEIEGPLYPYCQSHHGYEVLVAGNIYEHQHLLPDEREHENE